MQGLQGVIRLMAAAVLAAMAAGCGYQGAGGGPAPLTLESNPLAATTDYRLGPGETINIFVWRHEELTTSVPIRPDGRFSMPLVEDMQAAGKTPTRLARDIEVALSAYVREPLVTVIAQGGAGDPSQQIRVLGQAVNPTSLPYREGMTTLDVIIAVGGLSEFAAGNRAVLVRTRGGTRNSYRLRLADLVEGDITADRPLAPGDTIIIPESLL